MRRFLFDKHGHARLYLTGAGVLYNHHNQAVAWLQNQQLLDQQGNTIAWFDNNFLYAPDGSVLAFIKGSNSSLSLPVTQKPAFVASPVPALFFPVLRPAQRPVFRTVWSDLSLDEVFSGGQYG